MKKNCVVLLIVSLLAVHSFTVAQSPYESSWKKDGFILGGSLAISFTAAAIDDSLHVMTPAEISSLNKNSINIFDRWTTNFASPKISKASDYLVAVCIAAPIGLMFADSKIGNDWQTVSTMYVETALLATFLPSFGKGPIKRTRPYLYNPNAPLELLHDNEASRSFFSGHTTWAFASMTFLAMVYSDFYPNSEYKSTVWIASMSTATAVGLLRIFSGAHFPTDVLVGAVVGGAVGYGVPALHKVKNSSVGIIQNPNSSGMQFAFQIPL